MGDVSKEGEDRNPLPSLGAVWGEEERDLASGGGRPRIIQDPRLIFNRKKKRFQKGWTGEIGRSILVTGGERVTR